MRFLILLFVFALGTDISPASARDQFLDIREVVSPGGIKAWLVEDRSLPIVALRFSFRDSGTANETLEQQGLVRVLSNTMDEGAGDLDSQAFQKTLSDHSIGLRFSASRDSFGGSVKTLSRNKEKAFELMTLALNEPRFDPEPVQRMIDANLTRIRSSLSDPEWIAARLLNDQAFEGHPYALNSGGTLSTLPTITPNDLRVFQQTWLTKDRLFIGVAGDITAEELGPVLDQIFGRLPDTAPEKAIEDFTVQHPGETALYKKDIPQTVISIIMPSFDSKDPDIYALGVMNYIFGSAGFGSRLMEEAREKRGLTYGIYSSRLDFRHLDALSIGTSTQNESAADMLSIIETEMNKMKSEPVSKQELEDAKSYITGSMPLSLSSTDSLASIALSLQLDDRQIDYMDHYADKIRAVTIEDIQRAAQRVLKPESMTTVLIGQPANITPSTTLTEIPNVE